MPDELTSAERIAELERLVANLEKRVLLLIRISRLNPVAFEDDRMRDYCEEFQALCLADEQRFQDAKIVPLSGPIQPDAA